MLTNPESMRHALTLLVAVLATSIPFLAESTHLRSVEITVRPVDCITNTYEITVTAYLAPSGLLFGGSNSVLDFGDGVSMDIPEIEGVLIDSYNKVLRAVFVINHTYSGPGSYVVSYREFNRNEGILNMGQSVNTAMYTETGFIVSSDCNSTPVFLVPPVDRACSGKVFYHNLGGTDIDGDSLSYTIVTPQMASGADVLNYALPDDQKFYNGIGVPYDAANEAGDGPPSFVIDPVAGLVAWDAPGASGEYAAAIRVTEWKYRLSDSTWYEVGYVIRDMQIIVESCTNLRPHLIGEDYICVDAGELLDFSVPANDPDGHQVMVEAFSGLFDLSPDPAIFEPADPVPQSVTAPFDTAAIRFLWQTSCDHVRDQPYTVVFKVTDLPPSGPRLVSFHTVMIKVVAAAPVYESVTVNPIAKEVTLNWNEQPCENAVAYRVYRRVTRYDYDPDECDNGMPHFLRYQLRAELPPDQQSYTDTDLAIGALYCYRIVAVVGPTETESRISIDTCLIPKPAEAPVITKVSVEKSSETAGEISLRWTSPFDIDATQYPPPYQYRVLRKNSDASAFAPVSAVITDTTFIDNGINTFSNQYRYLVELYVPVLTADPVDSSSVASSAFLTSRGLPESIVLTWEAETPWYNYLQQHPYHLIYRSHEGLESGFVLIDSVDVNDHGFTWEDKGTFQGQPLIFGETYYYKVVTRGGYGNPRIIEPLENFTQVTGGDLLDTTPPCRPIVAVEKDDCSKLPCPPAMYSNRLNITFGNNPCAEPDIRFEISATIATDDEFHFLAFTDTPFFSHGDLETKAVCYQVVAIDKAGNRSEPSEIVCGDNCPFFALPNVMTPANADNLNDVLVSFGSFDDDSERCARFVRHVSLTIFNRWGKAIHRIEDLNHESSLLWDGYLANGELASPGVYFYEANVTFDVREPSRRNGRYTGWIHVLAE